MHGVDFVLSGSFKYMVIFHVFQLSFDGGLYRTITYRQMKIDRYREREAMEGRGCSRRLGVSIIVLLKAWTFIHNIFTLYCSWLSFPLSLQGITKKIVFSWTIRPNLVCGFQQFFVVLFPLFSLPRVQEGDFLAYYPFTISILFTMTLPLFFATYRVDWCST